MTLLTICSLILNIILACCGYYLATELIKAEEGMNERRYRMKFPTEEEFAKSVAEKALDEILYKGKSLREWCEIIIMQNELIKKKDALDDLKISRDFYVSLYKNQEEFDLLASDEEKARVDEIDKCISMIEDIPAL